MLHYITPRIGIQRSKPLVHLEEYTIQKSDRFVEVVKVVKRFASSKQHLVVILTWLS
jgi:hypothetical protein